MTTQPMEIESVVNGNIEDIKRLLIETNVNIKSVQETVGHGYVVSWSDKFKKITGFSPSAYRQRYNPAHIPKQKIFIHTDLPRNKINRSILIDNMVQKIIISAMIRGITIEDRDGNKQAIPLMGKTIVINPLTREQKVGPYYIDALGHTASIVFRMVTDHMSGTDFIFVGFSRGDGDTAYIKLDGEIKTRS